MTTSQTSRQADKEPSQADVLRRLWKQARRPHEILRAGLVERGLDRAFDDLNKSIREARVQQMEQRPVLWNRWIVNEWEEDKERLSEELTDAIRSLINDGLYIVLMQTEAGLLLLEPEPRRIAVFNYERDWVKLGDKLFRDVRLAPAWQVKPTEVKLLAGSVTANSLKEARKRISRSGVIRHKRSTTSVASRPIAANDDSLVPPSRQPKRRPPDYSAVMAPTKRLRPGPKCTWLRHRELMEERARQGILEPTLTAEITKLIEIAIVRKFEHQPAAKTLKNALGKRYRELKPEKPS